MIRFFVLTLFPDFFSSPLEESILKRARDKELLEVEPINIRDFAHDKHQVADDSPYGGGQGMVMKPEPLFEAIESVKEKAPNAPVILLTPQGERFDNRMAVEFSQISDIILICGRYEGVDERVREALVDREVSIGDYVLSGGETAALAIIEASSRFVSDVLGNGESARDDSFQNGLLEFPHYTRPAEYRGMKTPEILLSGDHAKIERWRREQSLLRTRMKRPDLLQHADLTPEDIKFLESIKIE